MNAGSFPTFLRLWRFIRRCLRRLRLLFFSRRSAVVYLILGTLLYLAYTIDRWHGRRAWAAEKERLAAAGESLDLRELLPKRPPDEENFCAIPELAKLGDPSEKVAGKDDPLRMWLARNWEERLNSRGKMGRFKLDRPGGVMEAPLSDWCVYFRQTGMLPKQPLSPDPAKELLLSAERWQGLLNAIYAASERPAAVFLPAPVERLDANGQLDPNIAGANLWFQVLDLAQSLLLHARACIEVDDSRTALKDFLILRRFAEAFGNEPTHLGIALAGFYNRLGADIFITGARRHLWSAVALARFEQNKVADNLPAAYRNVILAGREHDTFYIQHPKQFKLDQSKERDYYFYDLRWKWPWLRSLVERLAPEGRINRFCAERSRWQSSYLDAVENAVPGESWFRRWEQIKLIAEPATPPCIRLQSSVSPVGEFALYFSVLVRQQLLRTACAIERHYLAHRRYPVTLSEITASLPPEAMTDIDGQPFRYRTAPDGSTFRLWSVGRNGKDDTGTKDAEDDWSFSTEK